MDPSGTGGSVGGRAGERRAPRRLLPGVSTVKEPSGDWPSGTTRLVGVIGDPVRHSLSPRLHNAAFAALGLDWVSVALPVPAGSGAAAVAAVRTLGMEGVSVTMPLKEEVAAAADELTPVAARLGAANCLSVVGGRTVADSTDGAGLLAALAAECGFAVGGTRCAVVGAGGAARAVVDALARAGAAEVVVVARNPERAAVAAGLAQGRGRVGVPGEVAGAELVVNATPVGMADVAGGSVGSPTMAVPAEVLRPGQLVVDLVYHPARTPLLQAAAANGARTANGLSMLIHQAAVALERWTGRPAPVEAMAGAVGVGGRA